MKLIFVHGGPGLNSRPEKNLLANDLIDLGLDPIFWNEPKSFKSQNYYQEILDDLKSLVLQQDEKLVLIGHSSGCKNILNILPDVKHKVSHVCFLAPALDLVQASNDIIKLGQKILAKSKPSVAKEIESIEADLTDSFDELKERALMLAFSSNYVVRNFDSEASFNNYFSYLTGKFEFCVDTYIKVNRSMPLSVTKSDEVFDIPLLAILGAKDPVFGVQDSKSLISKYFTNKSILVYENTSHYPHIDEKEEFLKVLRSFLF